MNDVLNFKQDLSPVIYKPILLYNNTATEADQIRTLISDKNVTVYDAIESQLAELIKINNPGTVFNEQEMKLKIAEQFNSSTANNYGTWVFYPWSKKLVHTLNEEDFIKVRTNRNLYKITPDELLQLRSKKIGIIGLSVGQIIAQTIATERICGEIRLADFDTIELANLNRLNAGLHDIGIPKVIYAARKIAEIDPYINIKIWQEGINENNIDDFLTEGGKINILVEECDSLQIKIISRLKAKEFNIPVVMDTNDMGMLDIERFDLEPNRNIFHGNVQELEKIPISKLLLRLKQITSAEKMQYLTQIVGLENLSNEMKFSFSEINKTISGWPQLASAVTLGGAVITDTCRKILLGKFKKSGRFFVDFNDIIK